MKSRRDVYDGHHRERVLTENCGVGNVDDEPDEPCDPDAVTSRHCHRPENQNQRDPVRPKWPDGIREWQDRQHQRDDNRHDDRQVIACLFLSHYSSPFFSLTSSAGVASCAQINMTSRT